MDFKLIFSIISISLLVGMFLMSFLVYTWSVIRRRFKILVLIRGIDGAGKSTLINILKSMIAKQLGILCFENRQFSIETESPKDSIYCQQAVIDAMKLDKDMIVVSNPFIHKAELLPYIKTAEQYGYKTFVFVLENYHGNKDIYGIPQTIREEQSKLLTKNLKLI